jgi:phosphohistidine phosphatase SixA
MKLRVATTIVIRSFLLSTLAGAVGLSASSAAPGQTSPAPQTGGAPLARTTNQPATTLILVRHSEKNRAPGNPEDKDPDLSPAGVARAQELVRMFGDSGVTSIYATQYKRTQQTVKPLADKLGLTVTQVEAKQTPELVKQIRARGAGQVIFIAGHNNTVPEIIAAFGGPQLPIIPETEYDNLFVLTVNSDGTARLLKMKYGSEKQ